MNAREKLWHQYKREGRQEVRELIIQEYAYLAKYAVDRLNLNPSGALGYEDLIGHATIGLIDAIEKYDPDRNVKFETYALTRIRGEVIDIIRNLDWTPRSVRRNENTLREAFAHLEMMLERPPSDDEVAEYMGIEISDLEKMLADVGQSAVLSLDEVVSTGGDINLMAEDNGFADPAQAALVSDRKRILAQAIDELPEREKIVIALYYYENLTQKEIAKAMGVTESRVCQIHTKAVLRLSGKLSRTVSPNVLAA